MPSTGPTLRAIIPILPYEEGAEIQVIGDATEDEFDDILLHGYTVVIRDLPEQYRPYNTVIRSKQSPGDEYLADLS